MNNFYATTVSDTHGAFRKAGIKAHVSTKSTNFGHDLTYRLRVGNERGYLKITQKDTRLGVHPTNSPDFYAALAILCQQLGLTFEVTPTTLTEPLREVAECGTVHITPVIDTIHLNGSLPGWYGHWFRREHLSELKYEK